MKTSKIIIEYEQLLSLFIPVNYKQPFQGQPNLRIIVPYEEYVEFVRWLCTQNVTIVSMLHDKEKYAKLLKAYDSGKARAFESVYLYDILTICVRELNISQVRGLDPTVTILEFQTNESIKFTEVETLILKLIESTNSGKEAFDKSMKLVNRNLQVKLAVDSMTVPSRMYYYYCILIGMCFYLAKERVLVNIE